MLPHNLHFTTATWCWTMGLQTWGSLGFESWEAPETPAAPSVLPSGRHCSSSMASGIRFTQMSPDGESLLNSADTPGPGHLQRHLQVCDSSLTLSCSTFANQSSIILTSHKLPCSPCNPPALLQLASAPSFLLSP